MKTYKIQLTFSNPYIGSRNGGNRPLKEGLSFKEAKEELLNLFNEKCDEGYAITWNEAKRLTKDRVFSAGGKGAKSYFEYDASKYSIQEEV